MKPICKVIFLFTLSVTSIRATADPLRITNHDLSTSIFPDLHSAIEQLFETLEKDGVAVACEKGKGNQVKLYFRENLTINEHNTYLKLSINNILTDLRIVPEVKGSSTKYNTWTFKINPEHIDHVTLTLGSRESGFRRRVYKLNLLQNIDASKKLNPKTKKANKAQ
jgi:hypothetical protein